MVSIVIGILICFLGYKAMVSFNQNPDPSPELSFLPIILYIIGIYLIVNGF
jgi:hypothetical protein